jgi:hypothetical protein
MAMSRNDHNAIRWAIRRIQRVAGKMCGDVRYSVLDNGDCWVLCVEDSGTLLAPMSYGILLAEMKRHRRNPIARGRRQAERRRDSERARNRVSYADRERFYADA